MSQDFSLVILPNILYRGCGTIARNMGFVFSFSEIVCEILFPQKHKIHILERQKTEQRSFKSMK